MILINMINIKKAKQRHLKIFITVEPMEK